MSQPFLVEIHTEELPPKSLFALADIFYYRLTERLQKAELINSDHDSQWFATPRRLAVIVHNVQDKQADKLVERKGPALNKAFDADKKPTSACLGFAKSCNCSVDELITLDTPQGKFIGFNQTVKGKTAIELLPALVEEELQNLPVPKPMRWGSHPQKFIRPIHSIILLIGNKVIDTTILGCKTGNKTRGHRFHHPDWITIHEPEEYVPTLKKAHVLVDFKERKKKIKDGTEKIVTEIIGAHARPAIDNELLNEVTSLVEWPQPLIGNFEQHFLSVPQEALISSMQDHQRYFPILDNHNKLLPHFVTISNIESRDSKRIIMGNERVIRARLADADFFFTTDKKLSLSARIEKIKTIIFQNKLGTLFDKTERLQKLAILIAKKIEANTEHAERAALLAKTDLTTDLVGEFPELQGIAGFYYATHDQEAADVATALKEQYLPRFAGDELPASKVGYALALADRLDTLVGVFGINQPPTGDKDPFGLRRSAIGIVRILIEKKLTLDLAELINYAVKCYQKPLENTDTVQQVFNFIYERMRFWYQEQDITTDVFSAVSALNINRPYDFHQRVQAVQIFKKLQEAESLSVANKRVSNILSKYTENIASQAIDEKLFESDEERDLAIAIQKQIAIVTPLYQSAKYVDVLTQLATLRHPVDHFFDKVLVMADDKKIRENRLLLLKQLRELFLQIADIALLQP